MYYGTVALATLCSYRDCNQLQSNSTWPEMTHSENQLVWKMQLVQNAADRVLDGTTGQLRIIPFLKDLRWLLVGSQAKFEVAYVDIQSTK